MEVLTTDTPSLTAVTRTYKNPMISFYYENGGCYLNAKKKKRDVYIV
jgi:hypothetical protein